MDRKKINHFLVRFAIYAGVIGYSLFGVIEDGFTICMFHNYTGLLCYTCGLTRAFMYAFRFEFAHAYEHNPLVLFILPAFLFLMSEDIYTFIKNIIKKENYDSFAGSLI